MLTKYASTQVGGKGGGLALDIWHLAAFGWEIPLRAAVLEEQLQSLDGDEDLLMVSICLECCQQRCCVIDVRRRFVQQFLTEALELVWS